MARVIVPRDKPAQQNKVKQLIEGLNKLHGSSKNKEFTEFLIFAVDQFVRNKDSSFIEFSKHLKFPFVGIEEFLDSDQFLGATDIVLWPVVRKAIIDINKNWWKGIKHGAYSELVAAGSTGCAKTTICIITILYRLHILGCMKSPQTYYELPSTTAITIPIQAAKPSVTKKVVYMPIRKNVEAMPWFIKHLRPDPVVESEMYFPTHNIRVATGGSDSDAILGEAVLCSIVDEINFFNVIERSKKAAVGTGRTGTYDPAQNIYDAVTRRKKSRFLKSGPEVGIICVSSSTRYRGDFTDRRMKQIKESGVKNVYVYCKAQYQAKPSHMYCGDTFRVHIDGGLGCEVRILKPNEVLKHGITYEVPIEYLEDFEKDPSGAMRDIVGVSTSSVNPFFRQPHKIIECMESGLSSGLNSFLEKDNVVLGAEGMPRVLPGHQCRNPSKPRYVHVDLAVNNCSAGIAMVRFDGVTNVSRANGEIETLPMCSLEMAVSIQPDGNNEIDIAAVRVWIRQLKTYYGYPIKVVSYDQFNSVESRQQWKKQGMKTAQVSANLPAYNELRDAIYDGRMNMFPQDVLLQELRDLDFDENGNGGKGKVDHPPGGSSDIADAVCGAHHVMLHSPTSWGLVIGDNMRPDLGERFSYGT